MRSRLEPAGPLRRLSAAALLVLPLLACGDDDGSSPILPHSETTTQMGLQVTTSTSSDEFGLGDPVVIRLVLRNTSSSPVVLDFDRGDPPRYFNFNVHITNSDNSQVHTDGVETLEERTLQPGAVHTVEFHWDQIPLVGSSPVPRGIYRVYVRGTVEPPAEIRSPDLFIQLQ